jgi:hypothetical protein
MSISSSTSTFSSFFSSYLLLAGASLEGWAAGWEDPLPPTIRSLIFLELIDLANNLLQKLSTLFPEIKKGTGCGDELLHLLSIDFQFFVVKDQGSVCAA